MPLVRSNHRPPGRKLYLEDPYQVEFNAAIVGAREAWYAFDMTAFYPGGGGQPADQGALQVGSERFPVQNVKEDEAGAVWHRLDARLRVGDQVQGQVDWRLRYAFMRHHTLLHVANAVMLRRFGGLITGVQIGETRSRIDFCVEGFDRSKVPEFQSLVNSAIARSLPVHARAVSEADFRARPELVRTLEVTPPVVDGTVRLVAIGDFDEQACGGTHVRNTCEVGECEISKFDNKGAQNKRFYFVLCSDGSVGES